MPPKKPATKTPTTTTKPATKTAATSKPSSKTTSTTKPVSKTTAKPATKATTTTTKKDVPTEKKEEPVVPAATSVVEEIEIKNLGNVLLPDPNQGKWPCLLDPSERASTFLRYRDTNYLRVLTKSDMDPERIRKALLGGLRYGKPLVIDLEGVDKFDIISDNVNKVQAGLMEKILDKSILKEEEYRKLLKESDEDEYTNKFIAYNEDKFVFIVFMTADVPPPSAENNMHFILVTDNK